LKLRLDTDILLMLFGYSYLLQSTAEVINEKHANKDNCIYSKMVRCSMKYINRYIPPSSYVNTNGNPMNTFRNYNERLTRHTIGMIINRI